MASEVQRGSSVALIYDGVLEGHQQSVPRSSRASLYGCVRYVSVGVALIGAIAVAVGLIAFLGKAQAIQAMSGKLTLGGRVGLLVVGGTFVVTGGVVVFVVGRRERREHRKAPFYGGGDQRGQLVHQGGSSVDFAGTGAPHDDRAVSPHSGSGEDLPGGGVVPGQGAIGSPQSHLMRVDPSDQYAVADA